MTDHSIRYGVGVNIVRFHHFNSLGRRAGQPRVRFPVPENMLRIVFLSDFFGLLSFPPGVRTYREREMRVDVGERESLHTLAS